MPAAPSAITRRHIRNESEDAMQDTSAAKQQTSYDAIVVGSGISGGWAAKELTEKGLRVLLLERGRNVEHVKDYVNATKAPWSIRTAADAPVRWKRCIPCSSGTTLSTKRTSPFGPLTR